jgi:type IV pilus assembly protein PilC
MDAVAKGLVVFWRKLGRMIDAGVPLMRALEVIRQETENEDLLRAVTTLCTAVKDGCTFEEGLARCPDVFPLSVRAIVRAGESTGRLEKVLFSIADGIEEGSLRPAEEGPA